MEEMCTFPFAIKKIRLEKGNVMMKQKICGGNSRINHPGQSHNKQTLYYIIVYFLLS